MIYCLGDSFTKGFLIKKSYAHLLEQMGFDVVNLGENGSTSKDLFKRIKYVKEGLLIIFVGTNDFLNGYSVDFVKENVIKLTEGKDKVIIVIPPHVEKEDSYPIYEMVNRKIDQYANWIKENYKYIDARKIQQEKDFIDGVHLKERFHIELSQKIYNLVKDV